MKILAVGTIAEEALRMLRWRHEVVSQDLTQSELIDRIHEYDGLIVRSKTKVTSQVIERGKNLKVIAAASTGVDNIDIPYATSKRIPVLNAPAGSTSSVSELAVGLIIAVARMIPRADCSVRKGLWESRVLIGVELYGKTLGIIGAGRIGRDVASKMRCFGMEVLAYDPYMAPDALGDHGIEPVGLDELLARSDVVTIHAMLTDETSGLICMENLMKMKKSAFLVNAARGAIIVESDLVQALKDGVIAGAALDVFEREPPKDSPLLALGNVVLTPHIAGSTHEAQRRAGMMVAEDILSVLDGKPAKHMVNKELCAQLPA